MCIRQQSSSEFFLHTHYPGKHSTGRHCHMYLQQSCLTLQSLLWLDKQKQHRREEYLHAQIGKDSLASFAEVIFDRQVHRLARARFLINRQAWKSQLWSGFLFDKQVHHIAQARFLINRQAWKSQLWSGFLFDRQVQHIIQPMFLIHRQAWTTQLGSGFLFDRHVQHIHPMVLIHRQSCESQLWSGFFLTGKYNTYRFGFLYTDRHGGKPYTFVHAQTAGNHGIWKMYKFYTNSRKFHRGRMAQALVFLLSVLLSLHSGTALG